MNWKPAPSRRRSGETSPLVPARLLSLFALCATTGYACSASNSQTDTSSSSDELAALTEDVWQRQLETDVQARLREGLPVERFAPITHERAQREAAFSRTVLERLRALDRGALGSRDRITYDVLEHQAGMRVDGLEHYWLITNVLTPYSSPLGAARTVFGAMPVRTAEDRERYLALLRQVPDLVAHIEAHARGQMDRGIIVPAANLDAVVGLVRATADPTAGGPFAVAEARLPAGAEDAAEFREAITVVVESEIIPALDRLADFLDGEYRAAAPASVGLSQYPGGEAAYRYLVRLHTTMDVTPQQIHEIGLELVASLESRMEELQERIGFEGTIADFRRALPNTPEYFPRTVDEVRDRIRSAAAAAYARRAELFRTFPEVPYSVRRLDPALEGSQTFGYYDPPNAEDPTGYYNFNGSGLDERSWLPYAALAYHELFPGHHFQFTRQQAVTDLPALRRNTFHTAYIEGWGSYATWLGIEAGLLENDPLSEYGAYMLELFLATRLVVDTGMNLLGWSLDDGRDYMREHLFASETQILTESLRYSTDLWGQALAYQMGKQAFLRLREQARTQLGDDFDLRAFHETVLEPGSVPMTVLEQHVNEVIERRRAGSHP